MSAATSGVEAIRHTASLMRAPALDSPTDVGKPASGTIGEGTVAVSQKFARGCCDMPDRLNRGIHQHLLTVACLLAGVFAASAEEPIGKAGGGLVAPAEVVLYIHSDLKSTDFVQPLVCALQRVLTAPVSVQTLDIPLGPELLATKTQFDVRKVADRFVQATARSGNQPSFKYLLVPFDLKDASLRYVFATSFGNETTPFHVGVVSTARLDPGNPVQQHREGQAITATRAYKLILKSIARMAGLRSPDACVLAFPRSLEELDQKVIRVLRE
jgi:predicted Zn-dependent protease